MHASERQGERQGASEGSNLHCLTFTAYNPVSLSRTWMLFTLWGCLGASVVLVIAFTGMAGMGQVDELVDDGLA